ncbi:hypothetical protein ACE6H2_008311 [Prunus campanulata]
MKRERGMKALLKTAKTGNKVKIKEAATIKNLSWKILGIGLYQPIGMGCKPSSSSGLYQGKAKFVRYLFHLVHIFTKNGSQRQNHNSALHTAHKGTLLEMRMGAEFVRFQACMM